MSSNATHNRLNCSHCGAKIDVPPGHTRAKLRCPACGYYVDVPAELRSAAPPADELPVIPPADGLPVIPPAADDSPRRPPPVAREKPRKPKKPTATARENPNPRDRRPDFVIPDDAPRGPNLLEGTQEEDDDRPYAVPGDGTKACPGCNVRLPLDAALCVHCGLDLHTRKKPKKRFEAIDKEWEPRLAFDTRLKIFGGLLVVNVLFSLLVVGPSSPVAFVMAMLFQGGLQAFLVGTYEKLAVARNSRGEATLTKHWRIAFIPKPAEPIDWKASHAIGSVATHTCGVLEWITFFYLLLLGVVPGLLFFFYVVHPVRFQIVLCDVYGSTDQVLFRTTSQEQADEVCSVVATATGLMYRPVM